MTLTLASAQAATRVDLHSQDVAQLNSQYHAATRAVGAPTDLTQRHAEMLGLDAESALQVLTTAKDANGSTHYRYQQTFRGVPIWGEHVVVSTDKAGNVTHLFGRAVGGLGLDLGAAATTGLTQAQALAVAKNLMLGDAAVAAKAGGMKVEREQARKMIFVGDDDVAHMSYVVSFFADTAKGGAPTRPFVIVDAQSGAILKHWEGLTTALIGTGPGGNSKTGQYEWGSGGRFGFLDVTQSGTTCTMNNTDVKSVNLNGATTGTTAWSYACPRNTTKAINGAFAPINDAHFFGGVIQNMYQAYTGTKALTFQLVMRTHYSTSFENAFWDGTTMSFGDGATTFYPLVSVDVAGHEVSHGYTEQHSNLTYSGQSGGMNEAFSDMGGEATEFFWKGSNDFLVGPEIFKGAGALRYMNNPPQDGQSIDNAANFTSTMDVHLSSGVYNKAFWKLATTVGWDTVKAFKAFARANALYWTPSSTFNSGACGVETAATDLGFVKADVTAAFTLVGVACPGSGGGGTTALTNGVAVTGIGAATGAYVKYTMAVPSGASSLKFAMSGGTGDADMYVKFGSAPTDTVYDCRPFVNGNTETCNIATAQAGTYYVNLKAFSTFSGVSLTGSYSTSTGTVTYSNTTAKAIPDLSTITSTIAVAGRTGNAPTTSKVAVNITHTYRGDLKIDLLAPDGSVYNLKASSSTDSAANVVATYTVNLSTELLNGTWTLRVQDVAAGDTGTLNNWSITF